MNHTVSTHGTEALHSREREYSLMPHILSMARALTTDDKVTTMKSKASRKVQHTLKNFASIYMMWTIYHQQVQQE
jgi:hypothetical protein